MKSPEDRDRKRTSAAGELARNAARTQRMRQKQMIGRRRIYGR